MKTKYEAKHAGGLSKRAKTQLGLLIGGICVIILAVALVLVLPSILGSQTAQPGNPDASLSTPETPSENLTPDVQPEQNPESSAPEQDPELELPITLPEEQPPEDVPEVPEEPVVEVIPFEPYAVESTEPSNYITSTDVMVGTEIVEEYIATEEITFDVPENYTDFDGLITFRGDNFRTGSAVGTANLTTKTFGSYWTSPVSSMVAPDGNVWSGCGWTGQPLIANWPKETRQVMNMHDWAKEADELLEVIYATMDGNIYFMDLNTGKHTRDTLKMGFTFKGAGSLDPRGYPVLYVGSGYASNKGASRVFAISLIDFTTLFTFGNGDSFAHRDWPCFDSSPLVDAETDQLIYPGENGVLYIVKLNSNYDEAAGTLTMEPEFVRWRYQGARSSRTSYWLGMEGSAAIYQGYIFMADNGGYLFCLDLNTLELVWAQDVLDDTNASIVMELEDGHPYIYIAPSFHLGWRSWSTADVPVYKIDAETGEVVWEVNYSCWSESGVSGGVQGTIALGQNNLSDMVFVPVARTGTAAGGLVAALDKQTGEVVWEWKNASYTWSSPTIVYDQNGDGYLLFASLYGTLFLVDGATGETLDSFNMQGHMEATVGAYENRIVVGARTGYIWGIELQ